MRDPSESSRPRLPGESSCACLATQADQTLLASCRVATIAFAWCLGFGCWVTASAWSQTHKLSVYTVLIWGELAVCSTFAIICWLYMIEVIPHSFSFFFACVQGDLPSSSDPHLQH